MKIALLTPIVWRSPPKKYGPWEQITYVLSEALEKKGLDVTLFATGNSSISAKLHSVYPSGYSEG